LRLKSKVALVTGAGSGLGREIALTFAREGCAVGVNDLRAESADAVAAEVRDAGGEAVALPADVADSREVHKMFAKHLGAFQGLDVLVNNAGFAYVTDQVRANMDAVIQEVVATGRTTRSIEATRTMEDGQWRRTLAVHLDGTFYCTREALAVMEPNGRGCIINMASLAALTGIAGAPDYSAAKAAIAGFTKSVAREVIGRGIRVNAIAPGYIETPLLGVLSETALMSVIAQTPAGRLGTAAEVAAAAVFLASDEASYFVGQILAPNGGMYM
jgi:3-oxoacyl-[acyl-carrier protein] reductase